jgi:hypothetical protein
MKKIIYSAILICTMSAVFTSCREDKKDKVEDAVEEVTDDIGDGIEDATDDMGDGLEDVGDEIEDVVD